MRTLPALFQWLVWAAFFDWLVARTLTRMAIFIPKPPLVILLYQAVGYAGQIATALTSLLAMLALARIAWHEFRNAASRFIPAACIGAVTCNLLFLYILPTGWLAVGYHSLLAALILAIGSRALQVSSRSRSQKISMILLTLSLLMRELYQISPAVFQTIELSGPPAFNQMTFLSAELLALLSLFALWWAYGRAITIHARLLASIPALAFAIFHLLNPAMLGIIAIWSTGFTLYLPWPLYALGLWMAGSVIMASERQGNPAGWAVVLLLAGGLAPQYSIQAFLGIIALWLFCLVREIPEFTTGATALTIVHSAYSNSSRN